MKKGRHRRFEEARALKRTGDPAFDAVFGSEREEPCPECGAEPGHDHAAWCMYEETSATADDWGTGS